MAIYEKLSLSMGGGIISANQQAEQVKNTVSLFIGLGGTGVESIRTVKTKVFERLRPDDTASAVPEYAHICFIGVDADDSSTGVDSYDSGNSASSGNDKVKSLLPLAPNEFCSIYSPELNNLVHGPNAESNVSKNTEYNWLRLDAVKGINFNTKGLGGRRAAGRLAMMKNSAKFMNTVQSKIAAAQVGLNLKDTNIDVHVFAGLGGGTGSGTFLDVCYMLNAI